MDPSGRPGQTRARSKPSSATRWPRRNAASLTTGTSVTWPRTTRSPSRPLSLLSAAMDSNSSPCTPPVISTRGPESGLPACHVLSSTTGCPHEGGLTHDQRVYQRERHSGSGASTGDGILHSQRVPRVGERRDEPHRRLEDGMADLQQSRMQRDGVRRLKRGG